MLAKRFKNTYSTVECGSGSATPFSLISFPVHSAKFESRPWYGIADIYLSYATQMSKGFHEKVRECLCRLDIVKLFDIEYTCIVHISMSMKTLTHTLKNDAYGSGNPVLVTKIDPSVSGNPVLVTKIFPCCSGNPALVTKMNPRAPGQWKP